MLKIIIKELKHHVPFTIFGALTGIAVFILFKNLPGKTSYNIFYILHPIHVILSALVTSSMYKFHKCNSPNMRCNIWVLIIIGYIGSIGIATISDSIIPYIAEILLNMPNRGVHIGFIEKWWLINPLALIGIAIAYYKPSTKFPHAGHVLISTWASLFHILMAKGGNFNILLYITIFLFLFLAVWIPCCVSDIVFPLIFIKNKNNNNK